MSDRADARFVPRSGESWRDPFTMYAALRDHDPVHEVEREEGSYWALSRFDDIMQAAIDFETFSSAHGLTFTYGDMEMTGVEAPIVMMDPPEHTALRKLAMLGENLAHPSLRVKRVRSREGVYEGSINMDYRFLFLIEGDVCTLLRVGRHDILDKA